MFKQTTPNFKSPTGKLAPAIFEKAENNTFMISQKP